MNLTVDLNGVTRCVSGVLRNTTCAQLVYALAHATNQTGRFVLVAKFSDSSTERRMLSHEHPYELMEECTRRGVNVNFELRILNVTRDFVLEEKFTLSNDENELSLNSDEISAQKSTDVQNLYMAVHQNFRTKLNRPPPPAYTEIINQRYNSLARDAADTISDHTTTIAKNQILGDNNNYIKHKYNLSNLLCMSFDNFDHIHTYTVPELHELISMQCRAIDIQKRELLGLELTLSNDGERELVQLKKQQNNLQTVLNSMRKGYLEKHSETQRREMERIDTAIDATRVAVINVKRELDAVLEKQQKLEYKIAQKLANKNPSVLKKLLY